MEIGSIIRTRRLEKGLTQDEVAKRLGVTAPAVNKWEKGNSMPDIALLSPIARLLGVSLDELLSHTASLSDEEANQFIVLAHEKLKIESFETVFAWAQEILQTYPNSAFLTLYMARILSSHLQMQQPEAEETYAPFFISCYERALESEEEGVKTAAADALYHHYMGDGQFEKAEEYLSFFSKENPERKRKQAAVYWKTARKDEALKMCEELLYVGYQTTSLTFHDIYHYALQDKNYDKAEQMAEKLTQLAHLFEMGEYHETSPALELAILKQDTNRLFEIMQRLLGNVESISAFTNSSLYSHMTLKQPSGDYYGDVRQSLLDCLKEDSCAFVQQDPRFAAWLQE